MKKQKTLKAQDLTRAYRAICASHGIPAVKNASAAVKKETIRVFAALDKKEKREATRKAEIIHQMHKEMFGEAGARLSLSEKASDIRQQRKYDQQRVESERAEHSFEEMLAEHAAETQTAQDSLSQKFLPLARQFLTLREKTRDPDLDPAVIRELGQVRDELYALADHYCSPETLRKNVQYLTCNRDSSETICQKLCL